MGKGEYSLKQAEKDNIETISQTCYRKRGENMLVNMNDILLPAKEGGYGKDRIVWNCKQSIRM
ncbi:MAG: hypothetical protein K2H52_17190 [Lachnospiraceae bacterium]|nr:hypothetical protein [Lachnospiraceae bacterium]MDE6184478.1 hypothetical protein [Lachnospiraceae bacterium]